MGSDANDLGTAGLLEQPLSADAAASPPPDRLLGHEPSEDNEEEAPRAGRADAGQTPTRAAGPDAGPDADASLMGERGLEASSPLGVLSSGVETMPLLDVLSSGVETMLRGVDRGAPSRSKRSLEGWERKRKADIERKRRNRGRPGLRRGVQRGAPCGSRGGP